jgi:hypothetical protein
VRILLVRVIRHVLLLEVFVRNEPLQITQRSRGRESCTAIARELTTVRSRAKRSQYGGNFARFRRQPAQTRL